MTVTMVRSPNSSGGSPAPAECVPRWATVRTPGRATYGGKVAAVAEGLGLPLDPWQRYVADVALEVDDAGRLAYREVIVLVPRQSGKTTLLLAVMIHRALGMGSAQRILYTAQTRSDARKKWEDDHLPVIDRSAFAALHRARKTNGHEASIWSNGSMQGLVASTQKAGHGQTLDLGVLDEAFAQVDGRVEQAFVPAMSTRPEAQMWVVSTAGTPDSLYLRQKVDMGRRAVDDGVTSGVAYFEWSAPDDAAPDDPETWRACMPALGIRVDEAVVASAFQTMDLSEFRRAYLNQWTTQKLDPVIPLEQWAKCQARSVLVDPVVLAVDMPPSRDRASIVAAGASSIDGRTHVELIDSKAGSGWLVARLVELCARNNVSQVVIDGAGPAASFVSRLESALSVPVKVTGPREMARWCGALFDAAADVSLVHLGQDELAASLAGARRRPLGDAWAWARAGAVDISPLVAATLAHGWHVDGGALSPSPFVMWDA